MFLRKCAIGNANIEEMQTKLPGNLLSHEFPGLSEISAGGGMKITNSVQLSSVVMVFTIFFRTDIF